MLDTNTLKELFTEPDLRTQVLRILARKIQADFSTVEANAYMVRQLINLVRRTRSGTAAAVAIRDVLKEYLDFAETLVDRQFAFNNDLMAKLEKLSDSAAPAPATVTMNLSAAPDTVARTSFRIANEMRAPISVGFEISSFVSEDGAHLLTAEVAFDPPSFVLQPAQETKIEFILQVSGQFKPDTLYLATVTVHGLDAPHLLVRLDVKPARTEAAAPPAAESKDVETTAAGMVKSSNPPKSKTRVTRRAKPSKAKRKAS